MLILAQGLTLDTLGSSSAPNLSQLRDAGALSLINGRRAVPNILNALLPLMLGTRETGFGRPAEERRLMMRAWASVLPSGPAAPAVAAVPLDKDPASLLAAETVSRDPDGVPHVLPADGTGDEILRPRAPLTVFIASERSLGEVDALAGRWLSLTPDLRPRLLLATLGSPEDGARLGIVLLADGLPGTLRSSSTRTDGYLADTDLYAVVLAAASGGYRAAPQTVTRIPGSALARLKRLDLLTKRNGAALVPAGAALAVAAVAAVLLGMLGRGASASAGARLWLCLYAFPLAMLVTSGWPIADPLLYLGATALVMSCLAWAAVLCEHRTHRSAAGILGLVTACTLIIDLLTGAWMVRLSPLSGYHLQGIRAYGLGNEYEGIAFGMAITGGALSGLPLRVVAALAGVLTIAAASPWHGADTSGTIIGVVAAAGLWSLHRERPFRAPQFLFATAIGVLAAFLIAYIEKSTMGSASSHIGRALAAAMESGGGAALEVVSRKAAMSLRILLSPATAAAVLFLLMLMRAVRGRPGWWADQPESWRRAAPVVGYSALAALLFNDSGAVSALFLVGSWVVPALIGAAAYRVRGLHA
jgi:hypothetical protein